MRLIDSNIIIYSAHDEYSYLRNLFKSSESYTSSIVYIEVLGYRKITEKEKEYYNSIFEVLPILPLTTEIMKKATALRQQRKYSLGDSIIAATALVHELELYTCDVDDFKHVDGVKVTNPIN